MPIYPALPAAPPPASTPSILRPDGVPATLLSLERFSRIMSYSPLLFHQVMIDTNELQPASSCSDPVLQYTWQPRAGGRPGRAEIAQAILQAEEAISDALRFAPLPIWYQDELAWISGTSWRDSISLKTQHPHVLYGGQQAWAAVSLEEPVTYTDNDGDGYAETASITFDTTITDLDELRVFYPGTLHDLSWEIRPLKISKTVNTVTAVFSRHLCVLPELLEALDAAGVDGLTDTNFLESVDVYREHNDPSVMGVIEWPAGPCDAGGAVDVSAQTAAMLVTDAKTGMIGLRAADWDTTLLQWTPSTLGVLWVHGPSSDDEWQLMFPAWSSRGRAKLWYRAGFRDKSMPRPTRDMSRQLERAIAFLALALLDREWTTCEHLRAMMEHWRTDLAHSVSGPSNSSSFKFQTRMLDNPLGTTRAAVFAWRVVQSLMVGEAVI